MGGCQVSATSFKVAGNNCIPQPHISTVVQTSPLIQDPAHNKTDQMNLQICENILETLMGDKYRYCSEPFLTITTRYSSDSYTPMDLSMIKTNLSRGHYRNAQEFAADFRRMISETYRYCIDK